MQNPEVFLASCESQLCGIISLEFESESPPTPPITNPLAERASHSFRLAATPSFPPKTLFSGPCGFIKIIFAVLRYLSGSLLPPQRALFLAPGLTSGHFCSGAQCVFDHKWPLPSHSPSNNPGPVNNLHTTSSPDGPAEGSFGAHTQNCLVKRAQKRR